jgi:hypothetical protein
MKKIMISILAVFYISTLFSGFAAADYSGFLEDYSNLAPDKDRKGALIFRKPGVDLKSYTKVVIDPVEVWIAPDSKYKGIKPDEVKALADTFRLALVDALEPDYPVVSKPGPGVLGLRLAITNVQMTKKKRGLLGYTPVGFVMAAGVKNIGKNMSLQDATIEAELLDSQTNKRLGALIDQQSETAEKKKAGKTLTKLGAVQKGDTSWEEIVSTLKIYAERFRGRLDAERGR